MGLGTIIALHLGRLSFEIGEERPRRKINTTGYLALYSFESKPSGEDHYAAQTAKYEVLSCPEKFSAMLT